MLLRTIRCWETKRHLDTVWCAQFMGVILYIFQQCSLWSWWCSTAPLENWPTVLFLSVSWFLSFADDVACPPMSDLNDCFRSVDVAMLWTSSSVTLDQSLEVGYGSEQCLSPSCCWSQVSEQERDGLHPVIDLRLVTGFVRSLEVTVRFLLKLHLLM